MNPVSAELQFDFGSPNAYLSHRVIPAIEARTGVRFDYQPVLLGGLFRLANNRSPMEAFAGIPDKLAYERLEMRRFVERHVEAVYVAMWEQGRNMAEADVEEAIEAAKAGR
jgi:2-hydroxychromene-2-carboxylate isomerase